MSLSHRGWAGVRKFPALRGDKSPDIDRKKACGWLRYTPRMLFCVKKGLAVWGSARLDVSQQRAQVFCKAGAMLACSSSSKAGSREVIGVVLGSGEAAPRELRSVLALQRERH